MRTIGYIFLVLIMVPVPFSCVPPCNCLGTSDFNVTNFYGASISGDNDVLDTIEVQQVVIRIDFELDIETALLAPGIQLSNPLLPAAYACSCPEPMVNQRITSMTITSDNDLGDAPAGTDLIDSFEPLFEGFEPEEFPLEIFFEATGETFGSNEFMLLLDPGPEPVVHVFEVNILLSNGETYMALTKPVLY